MMDEKKFEFQHTLYQNLSKVVSESSIEHRYILHEVKRKQP